MGLLHYPFNCIEIKAIIRLTNNQLKSDDKNPSSARSFGILER